MKIALSGPSGAGKGYVADYLVQRYGLIHVSSGQIFRSISLLLFGDESKAHLNTISELVRTVDVNLAISATLRDLKDCSGVVFDSIRYNSDVDILRNMGFYLWRVESDENLRRKRLDKRGQIITAQDMLHASETEINDQSFDVILYNNDNRRDELVRQIEYAYTHAS